jgi:hypothetical protein
MNSNSERERPEELMLRLLRQFFLLLVQLVCSIAVGLIVVGKLIFDGLHAAVVKPRQEEKRKMHGDSRFQQDSLHDDPR